MKVHPFADVFPLMKGEPFSSLCADIEEHGLREPLTVTSDDILVDGRNRLAACQDVDVEPRFDRLPEGTTEVEILDLIMSKNLHRRHLDTTDRALLGVEYMKRFQEAVGRGERVDMRPGDLKSGERRPQSRDKAAQIVGVGGSTISRAAKVIRDEPDLAEKMRAKEITVGEADTIRRQRAEGRREGTKPEAKRGPGGSARSTEKKVVAMLGSLSGIVHATELIDPSALTPEDIKEFSEHVTALVVYRRKLTNQETED